MDDLDKNIIQRLQEDVLVEKRPFQAIAEDLAITEKELLKRIRRLKERNIMRRFGAVMHHRKAGFTCNAMVVWNVPGERTDEVGSYMASLTRISHCYKRTLFEYWPYNIYTMIHGRTCEECEEMVSTISKETGITEYEILYSLKELKKTSMRFFIK